MTQFWLLRSPGIHPIMPLKSSPRHVGNWRDGAKVDPQNEILEYVLDDDFPGKPKLFYPECMVPLIHKDLLNVLLSFGVTNIQFFKASLYNPLTKTFLQDYVSLNILGLVPLLDFKNTKFEKTSNIGAHDFDVSSLSLLSGNIINYPIFRLSENVSAIVVADELKCVIEKQNFPGISFSLPENWSG